MEITLGPIRVTKNMILERVSEERLMEHYLGIPVKRGLFKSPLRLDNHATCSYYRNKNGDLIMKDFSGDFCGNFISVVMRKFDCSYAKALQIIGNDFGILPNNNLIVNTPKLEYTGNKLEKKEQASIKVEIRDFQPYELQWWGSYGITKTTLEKFNIYSCKNVFLNGNIFSLEKPNQHIYGYYGGIRNGLETWRLYWPKRSSSQYKFISNWTATQIQGAAQLPKEGGELLVITKSMKDLCVLYEHDITAIAPNSENIFVTEVQFEKLKTKFKHIILLYDNDLPGIKSANKIRKQYPELKVAFIPRHYEAKDISDFRKKYGKDKTQKLIDNAIEFYFGKEILSKIRGQTKEKEEPCKE